MGSPCAPHALHPDDLERFREAARLPGYVNAGLTPAPLSSQPLHVDAGGREVTALTLLANAELVARILRTEAPAGSTLAAVAATRTLGMLVDDALHALVTQARSEGRTWQEIGDVLHTTRQAAFQRFKPTDDEEDRGMATSDALEGAGDRAQQALDYYTEGDWDRLQPMFDAMMREQFTQESFDASRAQLATQLGTLEGRGTALVRKMDAYTVVDIPMHYSNAEMKGRVAFNNEGRIAGLFVLHPHVA